jgi:uncharacterized protein with PQ loop repeat
MIPSLHKTVRGAAFLAFSLVLIGCSDYELIASEARSLFLPQFSRAEIFGFIAGLGSTVAPLANLIHICRRRSASGINPTMTLIAACSQIIWIYYGFLIASRPVILWNIFSLLMNFLFIGAYAFFVRRERGTKTPSSL